MCDWFATSGSEVFTSASYKLILFLVEFCGVSPGCGIDPFTGMNSRMYSLCFNHNHLA